uniref:Uncharacterized protein n=1 Tax=Romanomermis culicivorax TaxID=13658 RepID=A0A915IHF9_ROMCU
MRMRILLADTYRPLSNRRMKKANSMFFEEMISMSNRYNVYLINQNCETFSTHVPNSNTMRMFTLSQKMGQQAMKRRDSKESSFLVSICPLR